MHWFIYPSKDATLYKSHPNQNTGLDEVLEISKTYVAGTTREITRALLQFDVTALSQSIVDGDIPPDASMFLNLTATEVNEIPLAYTIMIHAASQSWEMGAGTRFDDITITGTSWNYKTANNVTSSVWVPIPTSSVYPEFVAGTTGSLDGRGGTWYTGSGFEVSQAFDYTGSDVRVDVTSIVQQWLSSSIDNNGFLLKHETTAEDDITDYGSLKFFSGDTNTIYPPRLEIAWDDSTWSTGSLTEMSSSDGVVYIRNLRDEYRMGSRFRVNIGARERYPVKTFSTTSDFLSIKFLTSGSSYYSIEDAKTGDVIIPFAETSKLSCDSSGNFFHLWTDGLQAERFYRIMFKIVRADGTREFVDGDHIFKLVR